MVVNPENQDIYVYYYTGSDDFPTLYAMRVRGYNHATFFTTVNPVGSSNPGMSVGDLNVLKYNKDTYGWDEQEKTYFNGYYVSSSDTDNKYNTDHSKLGIADPNCVIGFQGVDLEVYLFGYDKINNQDYYVSGSLFRYRGAPCFLPTLNTDNVNLVLDLNSFCANIYYPNDTTTDYFVNFRDATHTLYIKNLTMGSQYTYNFDMDISNISEDGTIIVDFSSIISLFELGSCEYEMTLMSTVYADTYDTQNSEFPVSTKYDYQCHYIFKFDQYGFDNFTVVSDSSGDDSILGNPDAPDDEDDGGLLDAILNIPNQIFEGLVSLILPDDEFLSTYFTNLYNWFCDRLGFLSYPVELFVGILEDISEIDFGQPKINIPDIYEPFTRWSFNSCCYF